MKGYKAIGAYSRRFCLRGGFFKDQLCCVQDLVVHKLTPTADATYKCTKESVANQVHVIYLCSGLTCDSHRPQLWSLHYHFFMLGIRTILRKSISSTITFYPILQKDATGATQGSFPTMEQDLINAVKNDDFDRLHHLFDAEKAQNRFNGNEEPIQAACREAARGNHTEALGILYDAGCWIL